jgi:WxL domain surface cell wall-binding
VNAARRTTVAALALLLAISMGATPAPGAQGSLAFSIAPALPTLPTVILNARSQSGHATMSNFSISDTTAEGKGWNLTVQGQSGSGKSPVFAQYCPETGGCSGDPFGYVTGGKTLPANSLTLNTTGASFTGGSGSAPTLKCSTVCNVDSATAVKVASAATGGAGAGTWTTTGLSSSSLTLTTATTLKTVPTKEIYRVNILWTLATGP